MVQFVVQKKFAKKKSLSGPSLFSKLGGKDFFSYLRKIPLSYFWIFFGVFTLFYGSFLFLKKTIFVPENRVYKVDYALSSKQAYDDPYLYRTITTLLSGENIKVLTWQWDSVVSLVQQKYPFVKDVSFIKPHKPYTAFVKVLFHQPELILLHDTKRFGVYNNYIFDLYPQNSLGTSGVVKLEIISFTTGGALTGIFFQDSFSGVMEDIRLIKEGFPDIAKLSYIPGGHRMIVHIGIDKKIYINNAIDIKPQIVNYQLLKKYYSDFGLLKEIDLGSLESDKVIVRK